MSAMPMPFLLHRAAGVISTIILISGLWFVADWIGTDLRGGFWLVSGLVLLSFALFGRLMVARGVRRHDERSANTPLPCDEEAVTGSGGSRLHVSCYGVKGAPTIVLTHDWGLDQSALVETVRPLARCYRVITWDLPGLGRSGRPFDAVYTVERFAEDLRAVVEVAGRSPVLLVGHGAGAMISLAFCKAHPELVGRKVKGVALVAGSSRPLLEVSGNSTFLRSVRAAVIEPLIELSIVASPAVHLTAWASYLNGLSALITRAYGFGPDPGRREVDYAAWLATRQAPSVVARGLRALMDWPGLGDYAPPIPVVTIAPRFDVLIKPELMGFPGETQAGAHIIELDNAGHLAPLEQPEALAMMVLQQAGKVFPARAGLGAHTHAEVLSQVHTAIEPLREARSFAGGEPRDDALPPEPAASPDQPHPLHRSWDSRLDGEPFGTA